jgi:hypothetical protein
MDIFADRKISTVVLVRMAKNQTNKEADIK